MRSCALPGADAPQMPNASINAMKNPRCILFSKIKINDRSVTANH
jgi:hypothetical protein